MVERTEHEEYNRKKESVKNRVLNNQEICAAGNSHFETCQKGCQSFK